MTITAVVDRIENNTAVLLSDGIEITIPAGILKGTYHEGDTICLTINEKAPFAVNGMREERKEMP
jgi:hypothetical protein